MPWSIRYYPRFPEAIPVRGAGCPRVTQPFATVCQPEGWFLVRLACVRRAASVHPEPGSNSPFKLKTPLGAVSQNKVLESPYLMAPAPNADRRIHQGAFTTRTGLLKNEVK